MLPQRANASEQLPAALLGAMRVLTDPRGRVQSGIVALNEELLRRDMAEFGLVTIIEPSALAYALVRLGESFLYADVIPLLEPHCRLLPPDFPGHRWARRRRRCAESLFRASARSLSHVAASRQIGGS